MIEGTGRGGVLGGAEENVGGGWYGHGAGPSMSAYYRFWHNIKSPSSGIAYDL